MNGSSEPSPGLNLSQSSHDRAHTEAVPDTQTREKRVKQEKEDTGSSSGRRQKSVTTVETEEDAKTTATSSSKISHAPSHASSRDILVPPPPFQFSDPCPKSMRHVRIEDLSSVDINWKMLTLARPTSKIDEDIFSK